METFYEIKKEFVKSFGKKFKDFEKISKKCWKMFRVLEKIFSWSWFLWFFRSCFLRKKRRRKGDKNYDKREWFLETFWGGFDEKKKFFGSFKKNLRFLHFFLIFMRFLGVFGKKKGKKCQKWKKKGKKWTKNGFWMLPFYSFIFLKIWGAVRLLLKIDNKRCESRFFGNLRSNVIASQISKKWNRRGGYTEPVFWGFFEMFFWSFAAFLLLKKVEMLKKGQKRVIFGHFLMFFGIFLFHKSEKNVKKW